MNTASSQFSWHWSILEEKQVSRTFLKKIVKKQYSFAVVAAKNLYALSISFFNIITILKNNFIFKRCAALFKFYMYYSCSKQEKRRTEPNRYPQTLEPNRSANLLFLLEPNRTEPLTWDSRTEPIREPHNFYRTEPRISADNRKFEFKSNSNQ
jgi:hypothetical protein